MNTGRYGAAPSPQLTDSPFLSAHYNFLFMIKQHTLTKAAGFMGAFGNTTTQSAGKASEQKSPTLFFKLFNISWPQLEGGNFHYNDYLSCNLKYNVSHYQCFRSRCTIAPWDVFITAQGTQSCHSDHIPSICLCALHPSLLALDTVVEQETPRIIICTYCYRSRQSL